MAKQPHGGDPTDKPGDQELTDSFFGKVLSATSEQIADRAPPDPALAAALEDVARRHAGQPLVLEPVAAELIEALLAAQFPLFQARPALRVRTARSVAQSLLADPTASRRLENLWASLGERVK